MQIPSLLSEISGLIKNERTEVHVRLATIFSYVPGDLFCEVLIGGSTSIVRARFINYDPVMGETVQIIQDGMDPIIIGKVGSTGPGLAVPIGLIAMWGNTVPKDWERCEGQSTLGKQALALVWGGNVPDLRYRFVQGAGPGVNVGTQGGSNDLALTEANMPAHNHQGFDHLHTGGLHSHAQIVTDGSGGPATRNDYKADGSGNTYPQGVNTDSAGNVPTSGDGAAYVTGTRGLGTAFDNRPIFYTVTYIVKVS